MIPQRIVFVALKPPALQFRTLSTEGLSAVLCERRVPLRSFAGATRVFRP